MSGKCSRRTRPRNPGTARHSGILDPPQGPAYKGAMNRSSFKIRRSFRIIIYILCALAGLYSAAWFIIADQLERGINRWSEDRRAEGWIVKHGAIKLSGYPLTWRAAVERPALERTKQTPRFRWSGPGIVLVWKPWQPQIVGIEVSGLHHIGTVTDQSWVVMPITLAGGDGKLTFGPEGRLVKLGLLLDGANIAPKPDQTILINRLQMLADLAPRANSTPPTKPHLIPSLRLNADIFGLTLPTDVKSPLGRTIGKLAIRSTLMGRIPNGRPADALSVWQKNGGTMEIPHLELGWASLLVQAGGTIALDTDLQPVGAMTGKISGYSETADALVRAKLIKPGAALVAKFALGALSRTPPNGGRQEIDVPLSVQEGWLFVGPVKLLKLPRIRWH